MGGSGTGNDLNVKSDAEAKRETEKRIRRSMAEGGLPVRTKK
jgi:hypothetical protein